MCQKIRRQRGKADREYKLLTKFLEKRSGGGGRSSGKSHTVEKRMHLPVTNKKCSTAGEKRTSLHKNNECGRQKEFQITAGVDRGVE